MFRIILKKPLNLLMLLIFVVSCSGSSSSTSSSSASNNGSNAEDNTSSEDGSGEVGDGSESSNNLEKSLLQMSQLHYVGAFRLPRVGGGGASRFGYGGWAFALNADANSIYVVGHDNDQLVAEVSIPTPLDHHAAGIAGLNTASFLQNFTDITEGMAPSLNSGNGFQINGLAYLPAQGSQTSSHLYWTAREYYNVDRSDDLSHGMSELDFAHPNAQGLWRLSPNMRSAGYIMTIPEDFANTYLGGKRLASGLFTQQGVSATSAGPALFAFAPWLDDVNGIAPAAGTALSNTPLVYYPYNEDGSESGEQITESSWWVHEGSSNFPEFQIPDRWDSAVWIETPSSHGIVVFGQRADGRTYYGDQRPGDCTIAKGYHGEPYHPSLVMYDPSDLAAVASGNKNPTTVLPYLEQDTSSLFVNTCVFEFHGAGYDAQQQLLYVLQRQADTVDGEPQPLIYVFHVED